MSLVLKSRTTLGKVINATVLHVIRAWLRLVVLVLENCRFLCHTIIETIQQIKARIKEIKEDEYSNSLTKVQVCAMFRAGDIGRNVLLKFIRLCMETASSRLLRAHKHLCPGGGGGGTPRNSWWGCAARVFKSRPYFRPKHAIFHPHFQT